MPWQADLAACTPQPYGGDQGAPCIRSGCSARPEDVRGLGFGPAEFLVQDKGRVAAMPLTRSQAAATEQSKLEKKEGQECASVDNAFERLPDELLLKIFSELAKIGPVVEGDVEEIPQRSPWCTADPHPGLRAYPFLSQVCKRWQSILKNPGHGSELWREVIIDFGHELITAVHTPIAWSDRRPSDEEFRQSFASTRLSATRMLHFVEERQQCVRRLVLMNSEGYWSDEGDFVNLQSKHNFTMAHFGLLLGVLKSNLQELQIQHCNDIFCRTTQGALGAISYVRGLRVLRIEDLHCRLETEAVMDLGALEQLEELAITGEEHAHPSSWAIGLSTLPDSWSSLRNLRTLQLQGHSVLEALPNWLAEMQVTNLDVSFCKACRIDVVSQMTSLSVLSLQGMNVAGTVLPKLDRLTGLTALNLSENMLTEVPQQLGKLGSLRFLDLSLNVLLKVKQPLTLLASLPELCMVDFRGIHDDCPNMGYWTEEKCTTMRHISTLAKTLKRRRFLTKVHVDTS